MNDPEGRSPEKPLNARIRVLSAKPSRCQRECGFGREEDKGSALSPAKKLWPQSAFTGDKWSGKNETGKGTSSTRADYALSRIAASAARDQRSSLKTGKRNSRETQMYSPRVGARPDSDGCTPDEQENLLHRECGDR